jgi:prepilin-type processing-associated H-X9-DG protein
MSVPSDVNSNPIARPRICGLAVASLGLGAIGFLGVTALLGLILGGVALYRIRRSKGNLTGTVPAIGGLVFSVVMLCLVIPYASKNLRHLMSRTTTTAQIHRCISNLRESGERLKDYATSHDGRLPDAVTWSDALVARGAAKEILSCNPRSSQTCGYAMNAGVSGKDLSKLPPNTVLLFESDRGWNGSGGGELAVFRHAGANGRVMHVLFADGSVHPVAEKETGGLQWNPGESR